MPSPLRSAAVFTLASALLLGLLSPACSQQGEGERCDNLRAGDSDCDSGLVCVEASKLLDEITDRCCKPDGSYDDSRCTPNTGIGSSAGGKAGSGPVSDAGMGGQAAGEGPGGAVGGGAAAGAPPDDVAGQGGQLGTAGTPSVPESGAPAGGMTSAPTAGQGGAD